MPGLITSFPTPTRASQTTKRAGRYCALALVALVCVGQAVAKNTERLWYAGGSVAFHSTQAKVGSNADEAADPRPDDFADRAMGVEDTASFGLTAGFGLTQRLSLQLDAGYFKGRIGAIDVYLQDTFPKATDSSRPELLNAIRRRETGIPVTAGELTEIPVSLSAILRFRRDRTLNPYLAAGAGMIFVEEQEDGDLDKLNARLASLRIKGETSESTSRDLVPEKYETLRAQGRIPLTYPVSVDVDDGFEWHLAAGMEWFFAERASLIADVRYTFATSSLAVDLSGEDQVNFQIYSERLFRPDGSLKIFNSGGVAPNPPSDPNNPSSPLVRCTRNTVGDFDHDGHADDLCYVNSTGLPPPEGVFLVQGGKVNLSGYNIQIGMRFYF